MGAINGNNSVTSVDGGSMAAGRDVAAVVMVVMTVISYVWVFRWARRGRPGIASWPVVGSVPLLMKNWPRLYDYITDFFEKGVDCVWVSFAFGMEGVYIAQPAQVEHLLKTNFANYPKGYTVVKHMEELLGDGIFNSDHEAWKVQRKVASFEFSSGNLRDLSTVVFRDGAVRLIRIISDFAQSNQSMDLQDLLMRMTLDSTVKVGFGVDLGCLTPHLPAVPFATAFDQANELSFGRYIDPLWQLKRFLNVGGEKELKDCLKVMDSFTYNVISLRREEMKASELLGKKKTKPDLLSRFLSLTTGSEEVYSDQALRDMILNFLIAGRDTTGVTLSWFIYRLCLHPEVATKILDELRILEQESNPLKEEEGSVDKYAQFAGYLTFENLGKLHYLHAALSETLRLYPAVPLDGKTALADDILPGGVKVKRGTMVTYCSYSMGRLEANWGPDAKEFKPERWLKNGIFQPVPPFKFVTFHGGPRACLGKESAFLQMKITAALLVQFFKFELVPDHEVTYRVMLVLAMKKGLKVTASPR